MKEFTLTDLRKSKKTVFDAAQNEPVALTARGKREYYILSYEYCQRHRAKVGIMPIGEMHPELLVAAERDEGLPHRS